jgi:hypothetical protein
MHEHQGGRRRRRAGAPSTAALWRYAVTAILGLSGRRVPIARADRRRSAAASSYEAPVAGADQLQFGRAYQLPPFGRGNGIEALFWTSLARLPGERVDEVLEALRTEDIPAWIAPARGVGGSADPHDLWVASAQLDAAQDVLMRVLRR